MLFNSYVFIFLFFPLVLLGYFFLSKRRERDAKWFLFISSIIFYGYWNPRYVPLLLMSICFNFWVGGNLGRRCVRGIEVFDSGLFLSRRTVLTVGLVFNVGLLAYFKYADFLISTFNTISRSSLGLLHVILPLGISFFTFVQIAYIVDSYHRRAKKYDFLHYALFCYIFPAFDCRSDSSPQQCDLPIQEKGCWEDSL